MDERLRRELMRIPGLYRRFELAMVLEPGQTYCIEDAGTTDDGCPLIAVYQADDRASDTEAAR